MARIIYRQMTVPRELPQQPPPPGQKLGYKSPRMRANFWCKSTGVLGGMVMAKSDNCIIGRPLGIFYSMSKPLEMSFQLFVARFPLSCDLYAFSATTVFIVLSKASLMASSVLLGKMVAKRFNN